MNIFFYLKHTEIDRKRWDNCAKKAINSRIFAFCWYLDIFCPEWECITNEDYSVIFPLFGKKKLGINYIPLPLSIQQSGPYFLKTPKPETINQIIEAIPHKYKYIEYRFTEECAAFNISSTILNTNYKLDLSLPYIELKNNYTKSHKKNIRRGLRNEFVINNDLTSGKLQELMVENGNRSGVKNLTTEDYNLFGKLFETAHKKNDGIFLSIYLNENQLCAGAFFFTKYLVTTFYFGANELGRETKAVFVLIDYFIKHYAGQNRFLDFSGSNIKNIAYFFEGFGAKKFQYPEIKINRLPKLIKILKK